MSIEEEKFSGGVAVVTGAGAGIGMGFARRLAAVGMTVVVTDVSGERAEKVAAEIRDSGGKAEAMVVDVSQPAELDRLAKTVFEKHGAVRVLVNNAGIETIGYTWEIPVERWEATLNINIHGIVHGCRAFVPYMLKQGGEAWIANLASIGSFGTMPTQTSYIMSKHAVQAFSECLYLEMELAEAPIHVCSVIPGMLKTSIFDVDAGKGEPEGSDRHRKAMRDMMQAYGMDLDEGCAEFVRKMAENRFWVDSQPDMTREAVERRIQYMQNQERPELAEQARALL
ncbi:SDR family NAD(P)-dependent oxidoreductase [Novosphingobium aquimarinum]|uniref:SDR family NAD(P)-dependent oxidoreductase n=1 Tax=Novosphingobium aquimarinum TaxID=2682494 RepID=UPI0012EBA84A|nr:SDR family NAD(P)-dependent oxidoreductase [Novosphingobium aquimarinum]